MDSTLIMVPGADLGRTVRKRGTGSVFTTTRVFFASALSRHRFFSSFEKCVRIITAHMESDEEVFLVSVALLISAHHVEGDETHLLQEWCRKDENRSDGSGYD